MKLKALKRLKFLLEKKNIGTASNIIQGVSKILKAKKKVIVLEDDLIVSKNFLKYMNDNLEKYKNYKKVWHISGWNWNFNFPEYKYDFSLRDIHRVGVGLHGMIDGNILKKIQKS